MDISFRLTHHFASGADVHEGFPRFARANRDRTLLFSRLGATHAHDPATIIMRVSTDEGGTWSPSRELWRDPGGEGWGAHNPVALVLPDGTIVLWVSRYNYGEGRKLDCMVSRSTDTGETWSPFETFDGDSSRSCYYVTDAVVAGSTPIAISTCFDPQGKEPAFNICWHGSEDGTAWQTVSTMTPPEANIGDEVGIAPIGGGNLLVLLRGRRNRGTFRYVTGDLGKTWSEEVSIVGQVGLLQRPFFTWLSGSIWLLTGRQADRTPKVLVAYLTTDNGRTFSGPVPLWEYKRDGGYTSCLRLSDRRALITFYADTEIQDKPDVYVGEIALG